MTKAIAKLLIVFFAILPGTLAFSLAILLAPLIALLMLPGIYGLLNAAAQPNNLSTTTTVLLICGVAVHLWLGLVFVGISSESTSPEYLSWKPLLFFAPTLVALWQLSFWHKLPWNQLNRVPCPRATQCE